MCGELQARLTTKWSERINEWSSVASIWRRNSLGRRLGIGKQTDDGEAQHILMGENEKSSCIGSSVSSAEKQRSEAVHLRGFGGIR